MTVPVDVRPEVLARYEKYMRETHGELDVLHLAEVMYNSGERHAVEVMVNFAQVPIMLRQAREELVRLEAVVGRLSGNQQDVR